jgi:hypothetical protein
MELVARRAEKVIGGVFRVCDESGLHGLVLGSKQEFRSVRSLPKLCRASAIEGGEGK